MTRSYIRACIVAVVLTAGTTRVSAEQLAVGNDTEPGMSGSPSVAAIGVDHVAMRRDHDSTQKGTLLQQALRVQAASLARTGAQLQSTKLNNDRKTKLIIIGIVSAAVVIWVVYELHHLDGGFILSSR
jgi:hypothetical protein